jgi:hypothetical protein
MVSTARRGTKQKAIRNVPEELWAKVVEISMRKRMTVHGYVITLLEEAVAKDSTKRKGG